ncbi:MAG: VTT domain-containing protein [Dehalococcoidia bacterium]|nr:VTT domain-containing protein [Dehalococcoidia bacterium]
MFRPWRRVKTSFSSLLQRIYWLMELRGTKRWLLLAVIAILIALICYGVYHLYDYFGEFKEYKYLGAFLVAFISSITVIFPIPGIAAIVAIALDPSLNWALVALAAAVGGGLGESTAYLAGYGGAVVIAPEHSTWYKRAENWMRRHGSATIFIFSITWLPFDVVGIAAGALRFPFWKFLLATLAGRLPKTLIGCYLAYKGWEILSGREWSSGLPWWSWVIFGVSLAVMTVGIIILWRRLKA